MEGGRGGGGVREGERDTGRQTDNRQTDRDRPTDSQTDNSILTWDIKRLKLRTLKAL